MSLRKIVCNIFNCRSSRPPLVNISRDRSRGGTDRALLSPCQRRHKNWLTSSRSQSDADEMESSLDISFEFFARSPATDVDFTKVEYEHRFCRSQLFLCSTLLPIMPSFKDTSSSSSSSNSSLPDDGHISNQINSTDLCRIRCEERNEMIGSKIPEVPFVPKTIFANLNSPNTILGTYEVREKVLKSLKQRVSVVDANAQFKS
ncbi:unnamed protein product, partial [Onchocerca flexuosa]|uniref:Uncharacterized protein n=1 Tax=Onchocerca flexuosa TaxID=387005 RepID=A0A183HQC0_9BILA